VYPDARVESYIAKNLIPVKIHVKEQPDQFERFGAQWTPTILILDPDRTERHRFEGFLPADDFLSQVQLGRAKAAFGRQQWDEAERRFREIVQQLPAADAAPEALYWAGVSKYKGTGDAAALAETATQFTQRYQQSTWAKKASVWGS
jgi:hypothetical protein